MEIVDDFYKLGPQRGLDCITKSGTTIGSRILA